MEERESKKKEEGYGEPTFVTIFWRLLKEKARTVLDLGAGKTYVFN